MLLKLFLVVDKFSLDFIKFLYQLDNGNFSVYFVIARTNVHCFRRSFFFAHD
jgi:hypothetical protein